MNNFFLPKTYNLKPRTCRAKPQASRGLPAQAGVTLIDTVIAAALLLTVFVGVAGVFQLSVDVITTNKARAGAIALADERMEYIRSLTYSAVGTSGGIPAGAIAQSETVVLNGITYTRRTTIEYVDDPGDGTGASDANSITVDYKSVRVDVAWTSRFGTRHITTVTRVEPQNGMEVACSSSCGTLMLTIVNVASQPVPNAQVQIVNNTASPAVNITTFSNVNGVVNLIGAPVATGYQITVSKAGYNSDQTYATPPQAHLTVSNNQTTSGTFHIDLLATKNVYTFTQVLSGTWNETMSDTSKIATSTNVTVSGGIARLSGSAGSYPSYGELQSIAIGPSSLARWKTLTLTHVKPAQTAIIYHLYDGAGTTLIPDAQLYGNSTGLATSSTSVDLSGISTSTYPAVRLDATFSSGDVSNTPSIDAYSIIYDYGPLPLPNISFNMRGSKTIATGPPVVYKYNATSTTGSSGGVTLPNMEYDTYTTTVYPATGYDIASSCNPQPETLNPGTNASTYLYLAAHTTNSLLVDVAYAGALLPDAQVSIWRSGTATTTTTTDRCGQAFFPNLTTATYLVQVSAAGHASVLNPNVAVANAQRLSVTVN